MARLTHRDQIRELLNRDRAWSLYALGDLDAQRFPFCTWYQPGPALLYREFDVPILFAGDPAVIPDVLTDEAGPLALQVKPAAMDELEKHVLVSKKILMWRMVWERRPLLQTKAVRLVPNDVPLIENLYADGAERGESPDFFYPAMVKDGVFYGSFEGPKLVAVAGTHIVSRAEGIAAIGNVYVHAAHRGRGLGRDVTLAVLRELQEISTIGLNVRQDNTAAIRTYETLGFRKHCAFHEGFSVPRQSRGSASTDPAGAAQSSVSPSMP